MSNDNKWIRAFGVAAAGAALVTVGAVAGTIAQAGSNGPGTSAPLAAQVQPSRAFPRNARGLSYGSSEQATSDDQVPDLVLVYATNGKLGYVAKSDLIAKAPPNPQQAIASNPASSRATTVAVYAVDGVIKIGEFVRQPGHPS